MLRAPSTMRRPLARALLAVSVLLLTGAAAEGLYRWLRRGAEGYQMFFQDAERRPYWPRRATLQEQIAFHSGIQKFVEEPMPRPNTPTWLPGARFYICYTGPRQGYFDDQGCVEYRFNELGLRDRPGLTWDKAPATRRVVCLGDSFTLGWGVRQAHNWPVLVQQQLRQTTPDIELVNCGGAGTSYADEYWYGLQHRFGRLQPDLVLVTLCLNDLVITNGKLCHYREGALAEDGGEERPWWAASRLLADLAQAVAGDPLAIDPARDLVGELIDLPADHPWYRSKGESPDLYWKGGRPQQALRGMREWCEQHGARLAVVVWPLLQGLGTDQHYPFTRLHQMVGEFCQGEGIPFCDLLPALAGHDPRDLWVSPADMHPNERAQLLVTPVLTDFVARAVGPR